MINEMTDVLANDHPEGVGWADRPHLKRSRQLQWGWMPMSAKADEIVESLLEQLEAAEQRARKRRKVDREGLREVLAMVVLALMVTDFESPSYWTAYPRSDADYAHKERYVPKCATLTRVVAVADFLIGAGLAEGKVGSYIRTDYGFAIGGRGYRSRLRATEALIDRLSDLDLMQDIEFRPSETIILKSPKDFAGNKRLLGYEDDHHTSVRRQDIAHWTAVVRRHEVRLDGLMQCNLYRVFNDARWDRGGRFYGGAWQQVSSVLRSQITIDGEAVVELDFGSLHPRLCSQLQGEPLPVNVDPYHVPGLIGLDRAVVKKAFMQLLNVEGDVPLKACRDTKDLLPVGMTYKSIVEAIERTHVSMSTWFRSGSRGLELQFIDASITELILRDFTRLGKVVLPVHDSYIVAQSDEVLLRRVMQAAYLKVVGGYVKDPLPPVIRKG